MNATGDHASAVELDGEQIHWDPEQSYGEYLSLDELLSCQRMRSHEHDEMLFVIIHQTSELWLKLSLHEFGAALEEIRNDHVRPALKMLSRIARIQGQLTQSWQVLATLTPSDYLLFRDTLGRASGFQSHQYRLLEFMIGNKNADLARVHEARPAIHDQLEAALGSPSLYDEVIRLGARLGFELPDAVLDRRWATPYEPHPAVEQMWLEVYRDTEQHWSMYELAEKLVDLEHHFQEWRFAHLKTVERIIGNKRGTGGSSGVGYLRKALDLRFFPELWDMRTRL